MPVSYDINNVKNSIPPKKATFVNDLISKKAFIFWDSDYIVV